jgi:rhamnose transport system substrate-binding protein
MATYPDLKAIIAPTTVGILAACQAVSDAGQDRRGQRDRSGPALGNGGMRRIRCDQSFAIWNPIDLGYAATMIAH